MDFQQWLQKCRNEIYTRVSTNKITLLKNLDLDRRIKMDAAGKYLYYTASFGSFGAGCHMGNIHKFLQLLENGKVYLIIPMISKNNTADEPTIILSRQILMSKCSDYILITNYINDKCLETINLYEMDIEDFHVTLKYKEIRFTIEEEFK